jgi:predicted DCC family thiol-disulfide oxidoreductase YuxK
MPPSSTSPIVLYDGVCGLCNWLVQFVIKHDRQNLIRFASLQSVFAAGILTRHGADWGASNAVYTVLDYGQAEERLAARTDAAIAVLLELGGIWRMLGATLEVLPKWLRDWGYGLIARNRYRLFGKRDRCLLPQERYHHKFLDM